MKSLQGAVQHLGREVILHHIAVLPVQGSFQDLQVTMRRPTHNCPAWNLLSLTTHYLLIRPSLSLSPPRNFLSSITISSFSGF